MGATTSIEWADASWNPIRARSANGTVGWHCEIVTPGCEHCYAQAINKRLGTGIQYLRNRERVETFLDEKMLMAPLRWRKPRMIFVGSMTDLFGDWVTDEMLDRIFAVMRNCPQHTFQVLTKRAERVRDYTRDEQTPFRIARAIDALSSASELGSSGTQASNIGSGKQWAVGSPIEWPLPNCWKGVSVEDQRRADERIPLLLATPAAIWFVSYEPALGPVVLPPEFLALGKRAWVICGGESGPGARPMELAWARGLIAQCEAPAVPVFLKQLGSATGFNLHDRKGRDPGEWPSDLRVREYPQ